MQLNDEEKAMLSGDFGKAKKWAIDHQIKVGEFFDAPDMVAVSQAHMMADPESVGEAGVDFMESIANDGSSRIFFYTASGSAPLTTRLKRTKASCLRMIAVTSI